MLVFTDHSSSHLSQKKVPRLVDHEKNSGEDKFRSFYENSMDGIIITTPEGKFISANPAACMIFETTEEELCKIGRDGIVDHSDPRLASFLEERKHHGKARGEILHIRNSGARFPAEISSAIFKNPEGEERTILIIRDITERKAIEEQIKKLNHELEGIVEEKTRDIIEKEKQTQRLEKQLSEQQLLHQKRLTGASIGAQEKERNELGKELHDNINQMLGTIKMYLGMVITKQDVPEDLVGLSFQYVSEAIEEIRKLSKSLVAPSLGKISLAEALQELINGVHITRDLSIELHCDLKPEHKLNKDIELMLYRVVQEQINNIRKYSQSPTATITIRSFPNEYLSLEISDSGVGFDTTRKAQGIGLRNISSRVEYYSGRVSIISSPGKGCRLEVYIPLNKTA